MMEPERHARAAPVYGLPARRPQVSLEQLRAATLVSFSRPSAQARSRGVNERMPYVLSTVAPTIGRVCQLAGITRG
jgi:hypothetical protein